MDAKKSLVQLTHQYREIENTLLEGEITPEVEQSLENTTRELLTKVDACAYVLERLEGDADYYRDKAKAFTQVARTFENMAKRLRERVKYSMLLMDARELCGVDVKFQVSRSGKKLVVDDETLLAPEFWVERTVKEVDYELVKCALENGIDVPGARFEDITRMTVRLTKPKEKEKNGSDDSRKDISADTESHGRDRSGGKG